MTLPPALEANLTQLLERAQNLEHQLSDPNVVNDQVAYLALCKEQAKLLPVVTAYATFTDLQTQRTDCQALLDESDDPAWQQMTQQELERLEADLATTSQHLQQLLLPKDPEDQCSAYVELRAGTGGDEAALFAADLFRMYARYAETMGWRVETMQASESEQGGFKSLVCHVAGDNVYAQLKFESGIHRVQRVPTTETQGRVHTSACTVAVLPDVPIEDAVDIQPSDLRIDTFRASGAGGQHVNTTDSAVRITHLPTGTVVECQDERSQHKNKAKAMKLLQAKIVADRKQAQQVQEAATRKSLVGSGDRSGRIRTYNFPQGRLTDHRIQLTLYHLDAVLAGDLQPVIEPLQHHHQAELLAAVTAS